MTPEQKVRLEQLIAIAQAGLGKVNYLNVVVPDDEEEEHRPAPDPALRKAGERALERLYRENAGLIVMMARSHKRNAVTAGFSEAEMRQQTWLAFTTAVLLYEKEKEAFSTFLGWQMRNAFQKLFDEGIVGDQKLPRHVRDAAKAVIQSIERHMKVDALLPDAETVVQETGVMPSAAKYWLRRYFGKLQCSLDAPRGEEEGVLHNIVSDGGAGDPSLPCEELRFIQRVRHGGVEYGLDALSQRERYIILRRYLSEDEEVTFDVIGEELGISRERARQIQNVAFEKMRVRIKAHACKVERLMGARRSATR